MLPHVPSGGGGGAYGVCESERSRNKGIVKRVNPQQIEESDLSRRDKWKLEGKW